MSDKMEEKTMIEEKTEKAADGRSKAVKAGTKKAVKGDGKVRFRLFKDDGKYKSPVYVGLNGKGYLIQRGVDVELPRGVYEILMHSQEQIVAATELSDELASRLSQME